MNWRGGQRVLCSVYNRHMFIACLYSIAKCTASLHSGKKTEISSQEAETQLQKEPEEAKGSQQEVAQLKGGGVLPPPVVSFS